MSSVDDKVAEVLALPEHDRAYLAHQLIASLDPQHDPDAEAQWQKVIERRSREIDAAQVNCQPVDETVRDIRSKLHAGPHPS